MTLLVQVSLSRVQHGLTLTRSGTSALGEAFESVISQTWRRRTFLITGRIHLYSGKISEGEWDSADLDRLRSAALMSSSEITSHVSLKAFWNRLIPISFH